MNYYLERCKATEESKNIVEVVSSQIQEVLAIEFDAKDFIQIKNYGFTFVLEDNRFKISIIRVKK